MKVLVINAGSSSLKYQLFDTNSEAVLAKGNCERIGIGGSRISHKTPGKEPYAREVELATHADAVRLVVSVLLDREVGCLSSVDEVEADSAEEVLVEVASEAVELAADFKSNY